MPSNDTQKSNGSNPPDTKCHDCFFAVWVFLLLIAVCGSIVITQYEMNKLRCSIAERPWENANYRKMKEELFTYVDDMHERYFVNTNLILALFLALLGSGVVKLQLDKRELKLTMDGVWAKTEQGLTASDQGRQELLNRIQYLEAVYQELLTSSKPSSSALWWYSCFRSLVKSEEKEIVNALDMLHAVGSELKEELKARGMLEITRNRLAILAERDFNDSDVKVSIEEIISRLT